MMKLAVIALALSSLLSPLDKLQLTEYLPQNVFYSGFNASSLSERETDVELEQRIQRLPLPDGIVRAPVDLFANADVAREYEILNLPMAEKGTDYPDYRLPIPSVRIKIK